MVKKQTLVENSRGVIYRLNKIPNTMFEFFISKKKDFKKGTASYNLGVSPSWDTRKAFIIENIHGTLDEAKKRLDEIIEKYKKDEV